MDIATVIRKIIESENQISSDEKLEIISEIVNMIDNEEITTKFVKMISDKEMEITLSNINWLGCYAALEINIRCFDICLENTDVEDDTIGEKSVEEMIRELESIRDLIYKSITGVERTESMNVFEMLYPLMRSVSDNDASTTIELTGDQSNDILSALSMVIDMENNGILSLLEYYDIGIPFDVTLGIAFKSVLKDYSDVFGKQLADLLVAYIDSRIQGVKF